MTTSTGFDSDVAVRAHTATTWSLLTPLIWTGSKGDTFAVPVGFVTDFATVPRILHWLVSPYGAYTRAAVLHDYLLVSLADWQARRDRGEVVGMGTVTPEGPPANSRDADGIFRKVMEELGVPWAKRWTMWAAVRVAALFNARRAYGRGFGRDAVKVLGIGLLVGPVVLPGVLGVVLSLGVARALSLLSSGRRARRVDEES